jgi:multimeric flavodoxin WrbA
MSNEKDIQRLEDSLRGKKVLLITTSNRWSGHDEKPKSSRLAEDLASRIGATIIDASKLKIYPCEGNVSTVNGNNCGTVDSVLKDKTKNPTGHHRCWVNINNPDDELWKISKEIFEADSVIFFASVRWGQTNSIYQKLIERLNWLENRWATLNESNILSNKEAGIVLVGHNWNGVAVLETQKQVLQFYGFKVPTELSFNWQWTTDPFDESEEGYIQDPKDFKEDFDLGSNALKESFKNFFKRQ